jgi:hypothetical protein
MTAPLYKRSRPHVTASPGGLHTRFYGDSFIRHDSNGDFRFNVRGIAPATVSIFLSDEPRQDSAAVIEGASAWLAFTMAW